MSNKEEHLRLDELIATRFMAHGKALVEKLHRDGYTPVGEEDMEGLFAFVYRRGKETVHIDARPSLYITYRHDDDPSSEETGYSEEFLAE